MAESKSEVEHAEVPTIIPTSYAAVFGLQASPIDFHLTLGAPRTAAARDGNLVLTGNATWWYHTVLMSPQAAKQLLQILSRNVAAYERDFGEIRGVDLPPAKTASKTAKKPRRPRKKRA